MEQSLMQFCKRSLRYLIKGTPCTAQNVVKADVHYLSPAARLAGKRIVITGGARGLGFAMAKKFISEGATVLITGRNEEMLKEKSTLLGCRYCVLDVRNVAAVPAFVEHAANLLEGIDILVNNAGISLHEGCIEKVTESQFNAQFETNLRGGYFLAQQFIKYALTKDGDRKGSLLFVSSERGSYVDDLPYGLTKAALNSLTQGLAYTFAREGIRVNAIAPGVTASEMTGFDKDGDLACSYNITGRAYLPEEVAEIACFLISDAAWCLNGQILVCNEGKSINHHKK